MTFIATPFGTLRVNVRKAPGIGSVNHPSDDILALYNEFEGKLRAVLARVLEQSVQSVTISRIVEAFETGVVARVEAAIDFGTIGANIGNEMGPILLEALRRGGDQALAMMPGTVLGGFDVTDPLALAFMRSRAAESVRQITRETEAAIRLITTRAYESGLGSRAAAREIRSIVGLTQRQALSVSNFRRALIDAIEADAGAGAVIQDFRLARNVLRPGNMRLANVDRLTRNYQQRWIEHRTTTIARNEAVRAVSAGRLALWDQAVQAGALDRDKQEKVWQTTPDERACPICLPLHNETARIGEPFDSRDVGSLQGPPAHIACRCVLIIQPVDRRGRKTRARESTDRRIEELARERQSAIDARAEARGELV